MADCTVQVRDAPQDYVPEDSRGLIFSGKVFADGSGANPKEPAIRHVAAAAYQPSLELKASMVPGGSQTVAAAEHRMVCYLFEHALPPLHVVINCLVVERGCKVLRDMQA